MSRADMSHVYVREWQVWRDLFGRGASFEEFQCAAYDFLLALGYPCHPPTGDYSAVIYEAVGQKYELEGPASMWPAGAVGDDDPWRGSYRTFPIHEDVVLP